MDGWLGRGSGGRKFVGGLTVGRTGTRDKTLPPWKGTDCMGGLDCIFVRRDSEAAEGETVDNIRKIEGNGNKVTVTVA